MNKAVVNIKVDPKTKTQAQKFAASLGLSLSSLITGLLKHALKTRTVTFTDDVRLELTPWAKRMLNKSQKEAKEGWVSPSFTNAEDAVVWLNDPHRRYQNGNKD